MRFDALFLFHVAKSVYFCIVKTKNNKLLTIKKLKHMKKALLTIALAAFAFAANAQFVVGGQIGYNTNGGNTANENVTGATTTAWDVPTDIYSNLTIMPKLGYNLNDKMQVGIAFGLDYNYAKRYNTVYGGAYTALINDAEDWTTTGNTSIVLAPYFRYNLFTIGEKVTFFCEAQLGLTFGGKDKYTAHATAYAGMPAIDTSFSGNTKSTVIDFTVTPGLNYKINDKFSADLYIDLLGLGYTYRSTNTFNDASVAGTTITNETTRTASYFYLTANANAQTIAGHLNLFRLGFNYHF